MAPIQTVRRELAELLGACDDRPETALDARLWLAELAEDDDSIAASVLRALEER